MDISIGGLYFLRDHPEHLVVIRDIENIVGTGDRQDPTDYVYFSHIEDTESVMQVSLNQFLYHYRQLMEYVEVGL